MTDGRGQRTAKNHPQIAQIKRIRTVQLVKCIEHSAKSKEKETRDKVQGVRRKAKPKKKQQKTKIGVIDRE